MTESTEQEIAAAWNAQADEFNQWDELDLQEKIEWAAKFGKNQADHLVHAVPKEPTSKQVVLGAGALLGQPEHTADNRHPDWPSAVEKVRKVYTTMLAAAPQPPEAAPVQMPDAIGELLDSRQDDDGLLSWYTENRPPVGSKLYTEHQVRKLLADHGITN